MSDFTLNRYEVVLANQYFLRELVERITLEDSLDEIAYRASVRLVVTDDFQQIGIAPGQEIRVSGVPFGGSGMVYLLHPGMVWQCDSETRGQKHINVTVYDRTIYLAKSEDEYLFPAGQTSTQRLERYASDWGLELGQVADTGVALAKAVYRARPIYSMIMADLKETAVKGGDMYRPRMTPDGLGLVKLGSNETVWALEAERNVEEIRQRRSLEGAVTQVKVLGNAPVEERSPVLALVTGETDRYGTLQKVHSDPKLTDAGAARSAGEKKLCGMQETITVAGLDINTIRAGDKVKLNNIDLLVNSVRHELGAPGRMTLELAGEEYVRRRYYSD
ncbi:XkdQ/YqbQ family protein [Pelotomaculum propionicicum]|uniref:XkdQ/YqbQ family protein n=1 Tax=Pelotomaculum propionicicum TaxID=258475 RepID=UPI003B75FD94